MGESITSGILASWHVSDGDTVEEGQVLYELETDKITSEGTAEAGGVITLKADEGDEVEIGQVVAEIVAGSSGGKSESEPDGSKKKMDKEGSGEEAERGKEDPDAEHEVKGGESGKRDLLPEDIAAPGSERPPGARDGSPAVRRIAAESGIDPAEVPGTGKGGRVTKQDMLKAVKAFQDSGGKTQTEDKQEAAETAGEKAEKPEKPEQTEAPTERRSRRKMSPLRRKIAERLVNAQQEAAILTTFNECDMSGVMSLRKKHQDAFTKRHGVKLGFMSFFCKAAVHALKIVPQLNAQIDGDEIIENHFYDIGVAIGTDRGLVVPVIRDVDRKSFARIEQDIIDYAERARGGKITIDDMRGGVFTITNGGIYGSLLSTPILNMPQPGILGMHAIQERPVARDGAVAIRPMMYLAVSYDHRLVDGKEAVTFLVKIKEAIEDPARLLFEI